MLNRRVFLRSGALAAVGLGAMPHWALGSLDAAQGDRVLVTLFLRGAMDGLAAVPPIDDPALARQRPGRDLPVTTDLQAMLCGVLEGHLGIARPERLFPGWDRPSLPLFLGARPSVSGA